jgi:arylsulfatase A-like enzyme
MFCRFAALISLALGVVFSSFAADKPNFLIIYTDDQGYGDVSTYHASDVQTPHIDQLAKEGMLFTRMRANCTVCSPSRAALLTGRYADRVGVPGVIRTKAEDSWGYFDQVPTLADALSAQGYYTGIIGKWHLGLTSPNTPNERGFTFFKGFLGDMMDSYLTHRREGFNYMRLNDQEIDPPGHATDLFSTWAAEFIHERASKPQQPFFLYLAFNAPHFPIEPPAAYVDKVKLRAPQLANKRAMNVAFVEHLDERIGVVLAALKASGQDKNTVVVFTSDNGGSLAHAQNNDPWRDGKQSHFDGGLRVPFAIRWPGQVQPGSTSDYAGLTFDIFATFLDIIGAPKQPDLDAVSLLPVLTGKPMNAERELYFVRREGNTTYQGKDYHALIRGDWKILQNTPFMPFELYNITQDPGETTNLAKEEKARFAELTKSLRKHIQRGGTTPWQGP